MTLPTNPNADPDPTTQIPWPSRTNKQRTSSKSSGSYGAANSGESTVVSDARDDVNKVAEPGKRRLTTWDLIALSVSMAGAQIAWTAELGYGTPFLLSLGLSEQLTSLVWLAGPVSGLIAQPLIGAISDSSTSRYRRRHWVVSSTVVLVFSMFALAYCQGIAAFLVDLVGGGAGDWDPKRAHQVSDTAIGLAIVAFYLLDFALNALQASLRNLLLDITPSEQLSAGNAWHGRMTHAGNIVGYGLGFLPLANMPILRLLGGDQFRKFCVVALAILVLTVWITCFTQHEKARQKLPGANQKLRDVLNNIYSAIVKLPKPIRRVCFVQVFAFMGWFPFLFYSTTYVGQVMAYELGKDPDKDYATRMGEFAMLLYSLVAVVAGTLLPHLARRDARLLSKPDEGAEEITHLRDVVRQWRAEAARRGKPMRLPIMPFLLRNIWTGALLLFTVLTFSTFFVSTVNQAIAVISLVGICWAVACWAPFAIIMEFLKELEEGGDDRGRNERRVEQSPRRPSHSHSRVASTPAVYRRPSTGERAPLARSHSWDEFDAAPEVIAEATPVAGGTILGIHNLAIVFPQFIIALVSSAIFHYVDADVDDGPNNHNVYYGKNGVAWVLRFGGLCTLVGALIARMVPPTRTEKEMRRRLGELRLLKEEDSA
ncbi:MFS general substrate transporter [Neolentinus lepideus HHB14362 ss-1]|uniref:MFS general substrate transporter n=1 Tax=Neolentinus lepideus HHB14362 ss-1 TaxID=1314782 RepID=A0A165TLU8_9AGAM|nr:MFS general substrate transporter [Neolentinus lepideus HHB14362 ss-1]